MGDLDRDQGDVRLAVLRRDNRRHLFVGLELDDEIDLLTHEHVGVALRDLRVVAVVDANELDPFGRRRALQPAGRSRRGYRGRQPVLEDACRIAYAERAEHEDRNSHAGLTQEDAFLDVGARQHRGPRLLERERHLRRAVPVGIRLDHRHDLGRRNLSADGFQVGAQSREIDFEVGWSHCVILLERILTANAIK